MRPTVGAPSYQPALDQRQSHARVTRPRRTGFWWRSSIMANRVLGSTTFRSKPPPDCQKSRSTWEPRRLVSLGSHSGAFASGENRDPGYGRSRSPCPPEVRYHLSGSPECLISGRLCESPFSFKKLISTNDSLTSRWKIVPQSMPRLTCAQPSVCRRNDRSACRRRSGRSSGSRFANRIPWGWRSRPAPPTWHRSLRRPSRTSSLGS